jgi:hypothetical protein
MAHPQGSVQGLCSSGATCFAICMAFLGAWGFESAGDWHVYHMIVLLPLLAAASCFGFTPHIATRDIPTPEVGARKVYAAGICLILFSVIAAVTIAYAS